MCFSLSKLNLQSQQKTLLMNNDPKPRDNQFNIIIEFQIMTCFQDFCLKIDFQNQYIVEMVVLAFSYVDVIIIQIRIIPSR